MSAGGCDLDAKEGRARKGDALSFLYLILLPMQVVCPSTHPAVSVVHTIAELQWLAKVHIVATGNYVRHGRTLFKSEPQPIAIHSTRAWPGARSFGKGPTSGPGPGAWP